MVIDISILYNTKILDTTTSELFLPSSLDNWGRTPLFTWESDVKPKLLGPPILGWMTVVAFSAFFGISSVVTFSSASDWVILVSLLSMLLFSLRADIVVSRFSNSFIFSSSSLRVFLARLLEWLLDSFVAFWWVKVSYSLSL